MDPLSITAGIIAVIGATSKVIKSVEKVRKFLKASDEICALINQLTDLKCVLSSSDLNQGQQSEEVVAHLQSIITRTNEKLLELETIINSLLLKTSTPTKARAVHYKAWFLQKHRIEAIQKDLRYLTTAFSLALATSTSSSVTRVELAVTALATTANQSRGATDLILGQLHQSMESLRLQTADLRDFMETQGRLNPPLTEISNDANSKTTVVPASETSEQKPGYIQIQVRRALAGSMCLKACACCCHSQRRTRSPAYLDSLMGTLFTGYSGLPINRPTCNVRSCRNKAQKFSAHFTYYFPWWFVSKALISTFKMTSSGPEVALKVARVIPDNSSIFQLARAGNIPGVRYLFEHDLASPYDIGGGLGSTPLHHAVDRPGNFEMVRFLICAGADPEVQDMKQKYGYVHSYKYLLLMLARTAADQIWNRIFGKGRDDEDHYIELLGDLSRTEQLERRSFSHLHNIILDQVPGNIELELKTNYGIKRIDEVDSDGMTSLAWAARRGDFTAVDTLLRHGADVSIANQSGATALYYAGKSPSPEAPAVIRALLKAGAPVNACTFRQETALHICVMYHDDPKDFISPLVNYGADISARDIRGISVLDLAIQSDHVRSVEFLLDQGVLLDRIGSENITGLSVAIIYNSHKVLKLLMEHGADSSVVSKDQKTLLHLAAAYADCETFDILTTFSLDLDGDARDSAGETAEEIFSKRSDKDAALVLSFEALMESLSTGSVIFEDMDPEDLTILTALAQSKGEESTSSDEFYDSAEAFMTQL